MRIENFDRLSPEQQRETMEKIAAEVRNYSGSPDFARKGSETRNINLLFMFFNARLQGMAADVKRLAGQTGTREGAAAWARLGAVVGIPATTLAIVNHLPQYKDDYDKIPDWEKKNYFMVPRESRFTSDDGDVLRDYWRIPKRDIVGLFGNAIESFVDYAYNREPKAFAKRFAGDMLEGMSPVNIEGKTLSERGESVLGSVNPLFKVPTEVMANRDFFRKRAIVPDYMKNAEPSEQYRSTTPSGYVKAGKILNVSPLQLAHIGEGFTGGGLSQFSVRAPQAGRTVVSQLPVVKRFVRSGAVAEDTGQREAIAEQERKETTEQVKRRREAMETLSSWRGFSDTEVNQKLTEVRQRDPKLADKIKNMRDDLRKGIDYTDRQIRALGVESGARQAFIDSQLKDKTPAERSAYLAELERKGLLPHRKGAIKPLTQPIKTIKPIQPIGYQ
jgi:hypothetical protein